MTMSAVRRAVADLMTRRGLPNDLASEHDPEPAFDPIAWRVDTYSRILDQETPAEFADARVEHPDVSAWVGRQINNPGESPLLLIAGQLGVGKTHQAWAALRDCAIGAARANRRCRWQFITHPQLNDATRPKPDNSHAYALDPYLETDLLVLDDLGAGKQSEWTGDALYRLVDHRWCHRSPTIFTTNVLPAQLAAALDERVVSRLATAAKVVISGPDRRRTWGGVVQ